MKQIFPKEILENTSVVHQFRHRKKNSIIYTTFLIGLIIAIIFLSLIKVDVYTSSRGLIKPAKERISLTLISSGKVLRSNIKINKYVTKGDTLLVLDNQNIESKLALINFNIQETLGYIHDAQYLIRAKKIRVDSLQSEIYKKEYFQYFQKLQELQTRHKKAKNNYLRNQQLFSKGVIAAVAFEDFKFDYDLAIRFLAEHRNNQYNSWQTDLTGNLNKIKELENKYQLLNESKDLYILTAPIKGTLVNVIGIEEGSLVSAGVPLAEISPDSKLIVECYISPADIGLLNTENQVKFQIEAFNYNQWGLATGKILEIGNDIEFMNETPVFKIRCTIDQSYLSLKNNYKGYLNKGMTLNAIFKITERTLFELLFDKMDNWLNPTNKLVSK